MLHTQQIEEMIVVISAMDRQALREQIANYRADFPLDFTPQFLDTVELDRLRHIFLALCLHHQQVPEPATRDAA